MCCMPCCAGTRCCLCMHIAVPFHAESARMYAAVHALSWARLLALPRHTTRRHTCFPNPPFPPSMCSCHLSPKHGRS